MSLRHRTNGNGTEEALRESENRYRAVIEQTTEGIYLGDADTKRVLESNAAFQRMLGYSAQELLGMHIHDVVVHDRDDIDSVFRGVLDRGHAFIRERKYRRKDGSIVDVEASATVISYNNREVLCTVVRDVTERKKAEEALRRSEERSKSSFRDAAIGMALVGTDGRWLQVNRSLCEMLGYSEEDLIEKTFQDISHPEDLDVSVSRVGELLEGKREGYQLEKRYLHADGHPVWAALSVSAVRDPEGTPLYLISQMQDITERKEAEEALREAERRYRTLVERIPVVTYIQELAPRGRTTYLSPQFQSIKGYPTEEALSEPGHWLKILHPDDRERVLAEDERTDRTGEPFVIEYRQIAKDGSVVWVRDEATLVHNEEGEPLYWLGIQTDVTERKKLEEKLEHQALHDSLTDLPNRRLFVDRLGQALRRVRRRGRGVAVLFMDLDGFKNVNDSLGHEAGDDLLVAVAERLKGCLRPEDTLARFGGDEFVVLLEDAEGPDEPVRVAERITRELGGPFVLGGKELYVGTSIGVAMGGERTMEPGDLLRYADTAMYRAKEEGSGYMVFDPAMHEQALSRLELENDLRRAVESGEFTLYYQPKFRLGHPDRIEQVETLVRWEHPQRGFMLPDDLLPVAREMGLIIPIDGWVMKEACHQAKEWQQRYPSEPPLGVCVNLSAGQVRNPELLRDVRSALRESGLAPGSLILEITEGTLLKDTQEIATVLGDVKALGVRLEIDDFGKEYSSLSYLNRLPVDGLKIDRLFLESFGENPSSLIIVRAVISLAHSLGLEVTGEGVQSAEQLELLRGMGCDFVQGYHLARPLPSDKVEQLLANQLIP